MKRINCFIPYGKIEATRQTVAQLAESSLVSQIYLITDDPHAKAIYPCNLIRTENIWSTKTLREIAGYASAHYTLIYTKTEELLLGMYALERFVAIADDTRSGMVYSDYYEQKEGKLNPHPVIDYQKGSLRDDFNFRLPPTLSFFHATKRHSLHGYGIYIRRTLRLAPESLPKRSADAYQRISIYRSRE